MTAGGVYGTITAVDDDEVRLRIADGVEIRLAKRAVAGVISEDEEPDDEPEDEDDAKPDEDAPATLSHS